MISKRQTQANCEPAVNTKINSLIYQVSLLQQRNKILSEQNQALLQNLQATRAILQTNEQQTQSSKKQLIQLQQQNQICRKMIVQQFSILKQTYANSEKQNISIQSDFGVRLSYLQELLSNRCSMQSLIKTLFDIIISFEQVRPAIAKDIRSQKLQIMKEQLAHRKQHNKLRKTQTKQIIHLVKQPESGSQLCEFNCNDASAILYQKLVMRVKNRTTDNKSLHDVLNSIKSISTYRKQVEQLYLQVANIQRELEFGKTSVRLIQSSSELLSKKQLEYTLLKRSIENKIQTL